MVESVILNKGEKLCKNAEGEDFAISYAMYKCLEKNGWTHLLQITNYTMSKIMLAALSSFGRTHASSLPDE